MASMSLVWSAICGAPTVEMTRPRPQPDGAEQASLVVEVALHERHAGVLEALEQRRLGRVGGGGVPDQRQGGVALPRARRHDVPAEVACGADH